MLLRTVACIIQVIHLLIIAVDLCVSLEFKLGEGQVCSVSYITIYQLSI